MPLPIYNAKVNDMDTVYTKILHCCQTQDQVKAGASVPTTADQDVHELLQAAKWAMPDEFGRVFCRTGSLHVVVACLRCTGKHLKGSGVSVILADAGAMGSTSAGPPVQSRPSSRASTLLVPSGPI